MSFGSRCARMYFLHFVLSSPEIVQGQVSRFSRCKKSTVSSIVFQSRVLDEMQTSQVNPGLAETVAVCGRIRETVIRPEMFALQNCLGRKSKQTRILKCLRGSGHKSQVHALEQFRHTGHAFIAFEDGEYLVLRGAKRREWRGSWRYCRMRKITVRDLPQMSLGLSGQR